jgi:outer membrane protein TolC
VRSYYFIARKFFRFTLLSFFASSSYGKVEEYFPELSQILSNLEENSPIILENDQLIKEQVGNQVIADSLKGLKLHVNLSMQSIYEDRPAQSFYHRYRSFGSFHAVKPIFHWGALQAESEIAHNRKKISILSYNKTVSDLHSQARHSYLDLYLLKKKNYLKKESLALQNESLKHIVKLNKVGLSTKLEVNESNVSLLENQILLADLQQSYANSLNQFKLITGWDGNLSFTDENDSIHDLIPKLDAETPLMITGLSSTTMKRIQEEIAIEENKITIANSQLKPKINLVGGFYQDQVPLANSEANLLRNNVMIGLEATWAIWDSSKSKGEKISSLSRKRRLEYAMDRELKSFGIYVKNLRQNLDSLSDRIKISHELLKVAQTRFQTSKIEFDANRISANKHLESKISLDTAKINHIESVCQYIKTQDMYLSIVEQNHQ